jgi:hypothetical protein
MSTLRSSSERTRRIHCDRSRVAGLVTEGKNLEHARDMAKDAIRCYIKGLKKAKSRFLLNESLLSSDFLLLRKPI